MHNCCGRLEAVYSRRETWKVGGVRASCLAVAHGPMLVPARVAGGLRRFCSFTAFQGMFDCEFDSGASGGDETGNCILEVVARI